MLTIDTEIGTVVRTIVKPRQFGELKRVEVFEYGDPIFWVQVPDLPFVAAFDSDELEPASDFQRLAIATDAFTAALRKPFEELLDRIARAFPDKH